MQEEESLDKQLADAVLAQATARPGVRVVEPPGAAEERPECAARGCLDVGKRTGNRLADSQSIDQETQGELERVIFNDGYDEK